MDKKYIVKNCPNISSINSKNLSCYECNNSDYGEYWRCMDRDCLIKQVIEKCREELGIRYNDIDQGRNDLANELFQLFEIEEVNNNG